MHILGLSAMGHDSAAARIGDSGVIAAIAGNEGTALGAAWLVWHQELGRARVAPMPAPYWGPAYSNAEIKTVLDNCKATYRWWIRRNANSPKPCDCCRQEKLWHGFKARRNSVRARSGIAVCWLRRGPPYVKENLNDYVKHRDSFRLFALAIPEERCAEYFHCSPQMAVSLPPWRRQTKKAANC